MEEIVDEAMSEHDKRFLKDKIMIAETILSVVSRGISRHRKSEDSVVRATLLLDKLAVLLDIIIVSFINYNNDLPDILKLRMRETSEEFQKELDFLLEWISSPVYSPDHHYGNHVLKTAEKDFTSNV